MILNGMKNMSNEIKKNLDTSSFQGFAEDYLSITKSLLKNIDLEVLESIVDLIDDCSKKDNTIYVAGNGGSAATASTFVNDVGFDVYKRSSNSQKIKIISLNDNIPSLTAISNDIDFNNIFKSQLKIHFKKNDLFIVFSGSGNSTNLVNAVQWVKDSNLGNSIGFLGFDGGKLKEICNSSLVVKSEKGLYGPVEDIHLIINHLISFWLQAR